MIAKIRTVLVALALGCAGCLPVERVRVEVTGAERSSLRLGVLPSESDAGLARRYAPVLAWLSKQLDRPTELVVAPTYLALGELVDQGKVEVGWFSGVSFLRARGAHRLTPLARVVRRGKTTYEGVILVAASSAIRTLADLKGKRFAYVDRDSGSGFLAPNTLLAKAGLDPLRDFAGVEFTYSHAESLKGLVDGRWDAAAVFAGAAEANRASVDPAKVRELARSEPLESDVIACPGAAPAELQEALRALFLKAATTPEGQKMLAELKASDPVEGFRAVDAGS